MGDHLFGTTDKGRERDNNEDVFIAQEVMNGQFILAGVIDGVGGYEGGEIAAALTKEIILDELSVIGSDLTTQLEIAFDLANEEILARKLVSTELSGMACVATLAVIDLKSNLLHYIHVGDTRLYLFRDSSLVKLSHDQSFVGFLEDSGRLTEDAAMQHPKRNQINQALGLESRTGMTDPYFEIGSSPFLPGDLILICSDGLTDLVDKDSITATLSTADSLEIKANALILLANAAGGKDNITVVLVKNDKIPVQHHPERPAVTNHPPVSAVSADVAPTAVPVLPAAALPKDSVSPVAPTVRSSASTHFHETSPAQPKSNKFLTVLLSVLCLVFLASSVWLYLSHLPKKPVPATAAPAALLEANKQEKLLHLLLDSLKGDTLVIADSVFKQPIVLSRPLQVKKDSLIIKTIGRIIFQSDIAYRGTAMIMPVTAKYISLNRLVFQGFETGIVTYNNALRLNNIQFIRCRQSVQTSFLFPDSAYVNGRIAKGAFQADSIAIK